MHLFGKSIRAAVAKNSNRSVGSNRSRPTNVIAQRVRTTQPNIMHRISVEGLKTQRAADRDHFVFDLEMTIALVVQDGLAANDAMVFPIHYVGVFQFAHDVLILLWSNVNSPAANNTTMFQITNPETNVVKVVTFSPMLTCMCSA